MVTIFKKYNSFYGFYKTFAKIYQLFGISPKCSDDTFGKPLLCTKLLIRFFITLYWIGVGLTVLRTELPNNSVSIASNFLQLLLNALALTAALVNPLWKYGEYQEMILLLDKIDHQISEMKRTVDYRKQVKLFFAVTSTFLFLIIYNYAFDFYVSIWKNDVRLPYWILYSVPLIVYAASLHQAIFFIFSIHKRLQMASELLNINGSILEEGKNCWLERPEITPTNYFLTNSRAHQPKNISEAKIFRLIKDIYLLCLKVDRYFGIVLLLALGALFSVSSIQSFYCFMITAHFDSTKNRTVWELIACINLILINMLLVVGLSCASEMVTNDVNCILTIVLETQPTNKPSLNDFHNWLHPMLSRIHFSAFGFFNINYNMLFGFISALITYLIILIQFNAISKEPLLPSYNHAGDYEVKTNDSIFSSLYRGGASEVMGNATDWVE